MFSIVTSVVLAGIYSVVMMISSAFYFSTEFSVTLFYFMLLISYFVPIFSSNTSKHFFKLLKLCFFPSNCIMFSEVLLADMLTSLSKVFKDFGITLIAIYAKYSGTDIFLLHNEGMIVIALFASLPFAIRIQQCYIQLDNSDDATQKILIALNLLKYISALPPIWLSVIASLVHTNSYINTITLATLIINSLISFLWDLIMDWGIVRVSKHRVKLRDCYLFPSPFYLVVIFCNFILRFSWLANRLQFLRHLHSSELIFLVEILEILRRSMWNMLRIEWEIICQQDKV